MRKIFFLSIVLLVSFNLHCQSLVSSSNQNQIANKHLIPLNRVSYAIGTVENNPNTMKYNIGDIAFGGIIFYIDESGEHGLVCSFQDQSQNAKWGKKRKIRKNERLSEEFNSTTTIFGKKQKKDRFKRNNYANRLCKKLKSGFENDTYKDWYLPSKEELNLLYESRNEIDKAANENGGNMLEDTYYWSSSEYNFDKVWVQYFSTGKQTIQYKNYENNVRAIRSF